MVKRKVLGKVVRPPDHLVFVDKKGNVIAVPMKRRKSKRR